MNNDSLGDRMKRYENESRLYFRNRAPMIIRIDGRSFHNFTKGFMRPFDDLLISAMQETAIYLCENISGCVLGYTQSDEISLLIIDYQRQETQPWFAKNIQKIASVSASMATMAFNRAFSLAIHKQGIDGLTANGLKSHVPDQVYEKYLEKEGTAMFDSRAFIMPFDEVCSYFIWRQRDAIRNSVQMVAHTYFSHKSLQNLNTSDIKEKLMSEFGFAWDNIPTVYQRGSAIYRKPFLIGDTLRHSWVVDRDTPLFTHKSNYINCRIPEYDIN